MIFLILYYSILKINSGFLRKLLFKEFLLRLF